MIRSMTGFGSAATQVDGAHYSVELRSLNNRYFKTQVRLPEELQALEAEFDAQLGRAFARGSVTLTIRFSDCSADAAATINQAAVARYLEQLLGVPGLDHASARIDLGAIIALPGVMMTGTGEERLERARAVLPGLLETACAKLVAMRDREGAALRDELHRHLETIAGHLGGMRDRVPRMIEQYQEKLRQRMQALLDEVGASVREEDLLREVAVYAERTDVAEEISRLAAHIEQFGELIDAESATPTGRTLDFLAQEMLREANTIGSKCLDVDVSRRIVEVKGAIDRLKEQVQNVE